MKMYEHILKKDNTPTQSKFFELQNMAERIAETILNRKLTMLTDLKPLLMDYTKHFEKMRK